MTGTTSLSRQALGDEIKRLDTMIARARHELGQGVLIDLAPMEGLIEGLCEALQSLPAQEGKQVLPDLTALLDELGQLSNSLDEGLETLKGQLGDHSKRTQGMAAYGKSPGPRKYR